jgi:hypothetical protein
MANKQASKGLPKRTGKKKMAAAGKKARELARKAVRVKAQEQRHAANLETLAQGGLTPWQKAKAARRAKRAAKRAA